MTIDLKDIGRFALRVIGALALVAIAVYLYRAGIALQSPRGTLYGAYLQTRAQVFRADVLWPAIIAAVAGFWSARWLWPNKVIK